MLKKQIQEKGLQGTIIERSDERLVVLSLSARIERSWNVREEALRLVYAEALLAGSGKHGRTAFLDALAAQGISLHVSSDADYVHIDLQAIDTTLNTALSLLGLILREPRFEQKEIKRITEYLTNAFILAKEDARSRAHERFSNTFTEVSDPRYRHTLDELMATLRAIERKDLLELHTAFAVSVWQYTAGGSEKSLKIIEKELSKFRNKTNEVVQIMPDARETLPIKKRLVHLLDIPSKHNIELSIGGHLPLTREHTDYPAFVFGMYVLALYGGFTGRLMSIVREKEGLTYGIYGQAERATVTKTGFWRIMTFFNPKDVVQGITSTLREITRMHEKGITDSELERFKVILRTRYAMIEDSIVKKVKEVHTYTLLGHTDASFEEYQQKLLRVTKAEVNKAMRKYLDPSTMVISAAGPVSSIEKKLKEFAR